MKLFSGKLVVIVQSTKEKGTMTLSVSGDDLENGELSIDIGN